MPGFEMRLGAAQISPGGFSHLPKLEFPLGVDGKPPFEGWFEESRDDYGPKFELRADLNRRAFDLGVWSKVPKSSQVMLLSLIAGLPSAIQLCESKAINLSRPWSDWAQLSSRMIEVIRERLTATPRSAPIAQPSLSSQPLPTRTPKAQPSGTPSPVPGPPQGQAVIPTLPPLPTTEPRQVRHSPRGGGNAAAVEVEVKSTGSVTKKTRVATTQATKAGKKV